MMKELTKKEMLEVIREKGKLKMDCLVYIRETEIIKHENDKERMRIKNANIRRQKELELRYK